MVASAVANNLLQEERFEAVRELLAQHRVSPDDQDALLQLIRARGWRVSDEFADGEWTVTVAEEGPHGIEVAWGVDPEHGIAILRALGDIIYTLSPKQHLELFDLNTRDMLGISAEEFKSRWQSNALPLNDPRVTHLMLLVPYEWKSAQ